MKKYFIFAILFTVSSLYAAEDLLKFSSPENEHRYYRLIEEFRCPKCLNQSIADSNAGISEDLRNIVYEKIEAGFSDQEIRLFLKERYGDFILYKPEVGGVNLVLWFAPVLLMLIIMAGLLFRFIRKKQEEDVTGLSETELQELENLLKDSEGEN
jgi:cytochrome c-type biogenesis protein CcmH